MFINCQYINDRHEEKQLHFMVININGARAGNHWTWSESKLRPCVGETAVISATLQVYVVKMYGAIKLYAIEIHFYAAHYVLYFLLLDSLYNAYNRGEIGLAAGLLINIVLWQFGGQSADCVHVSLSPRSRIVQMELATQ